MAQLTRNVLRKIETILRDRQKALLEEVRGELEQREDQHLIDFLRGEPGDSGDVSLADALSDLNIARADRQIHELREIEAAFGRIKDGSFGECIDCGQDIGYERLLANPVAKRCLICQEKHEQGHAQEGHPSL